MNILHSLHSSVFVLPDGSCGECRRGPLYYFDIPSPIRWASVHEWLQAAPFVRHYFSEFPQPNNWNYDQYLLSQWFHESNLWYDSETSEWVIGDPVVYVRNQNTGYMIPVFMDLETGIMNIKGHPVHSFAEAGIQVSEIWRMELGDLYRVM